MASDPFEWQNKMQALADSRPDGMLTIADLEPILHHYDPSKRKYGLINAYRCRWRHVVVTRDVDFGVTPFIIRCPRCGDDAQSSMYRVKQESLWTHEWYRPAKHEPDGHYENGGLYLRPRTGVDCDEREIKTIEPRGPGGLVRF